MLPVRQANQGSRVISIAFQQKSIRVTVIVVWPAQAFENYLSTCFSDFPFMPFLPLSFVYYYTREIDIYRRFFADHFRNIW